MNAIATFPVRPPYIDGESLAGYVYRVHDANGHQVPYALNKAVLSLYRGWAATEIARKDGVKRVQQFLGKKCSLHEPYWLDDQQKIQRSSSWPRWSGLQGDQFAVCPLCLKEFRAHLAIWELPLVSACALHRCQLAKMCPSCGENIVWTQLLCDWTCRCGLHLIDIEALPASELDCNFAEAIANSSDVLVPDGLHQRTAQAKSRSVCIDALPLELFYKRLYKLRDLRRLIVDGTLPGKLDYSYPASRARTQPSSWEWSMMVNWPKGFQDWSIRSVRRLFRANAQTFVHLRSERLVSQFLYATSRLQEVDEQVEPIYLATLVSLEQFKAPLHERLNGFFNPRLSQAERNVQLGELRDWWQANRAISQRQGSESQTSEEMKLVYPGSEAHRTKIVLILLNRLMSCALTGMPPHRCTTWISLWPDVSGVDLNGATLIYDLSAKLLMQPIWWLQTLLEMAPEIGEGAGDVE